MKLDLGKILQSINKGSKASTDTLFVSNKNDQRLKAYQDSLSLYKDARKYYDVRTGPTSGSKDKSWRDFKVHPFHKGYTKKDALEQLKENAFDIPKENLKYFDKESIQNQERFKRISKKTFQSKINPIGTYPLEGFAPAYKKPVQPVAYREEVKKKEEPKMASIKREVEQAIQNKYEGNPVYYPTVGSGGPSALVGFSNITDTTFIKPEDFDRFAVPRYAKEFIKSKSKKK